MVLRKAIGTKDGGRYVELSPEEERKVRKEWAENDKMEVLEIAEEERKKQLKNEAREKISALAGLSDEQKELLFG